MIIRSLPDGLPFTAQTRSLEGRAAVVEIRGGGDLQLNQPVELSDDTFVFLGQVQQLEMDGDTLVAYLDLEHRLDRRLLAEVQAGWGENTPEKKGLPS